MTTYETFGYYKIETRKTVNALWNVYRYYRVPASLIREFLDNYMTACGLANPELVRLSRVATAPESRQTWSYLGSKNRYE